MAETSNSRPSTARSCAVGITCRTSALRMMEHMQVSNLSLRTQSAGALNVRE
jgi:hypothetical protein